MLMYQRGIVHILLILVGLVLILVLLGYFSTPKKYTNPPQTEHTYYYQPQ
jgi:hypothetical protein